ncbi:MAG: 7-cyano-7-deazaguanine synthase QueC [Elusimicrobia bacterium]|nr:7-cyano-7-deazaguanine synthase QueC [Elusimicrobiota bacterium]
MRRGRAIILLSGGLDSATALYWAAHRGYRTTALSVGYGQRHARELSCARRLARAAGADWVRVRLAPPWLRSSSLVDAARPLPDMPAARIGFGAIPSTYVPGRNAVLLALAVSLADARGAEAVVIGTNHRDCSGYPDCRPAFLRAFAKAVSLGTKRGALGRRLDILAPLQKLEKAGIVRLGLRLGVPLGWTWSCYRGGERPCGRCDSCKLRARGFREAGAADPALR